IVPAWLTAHAGITNRRRRYLILRLKLSSLPLEWSHSIIAGPDACRKIAIPIKHPHSAFCQPPRLRHLGETQTSHRRQGPSPTHQLRGDEGVDLVDLPEIEQVPQHAAPSFN